MTCEMCAWVVGDYCLKNKNHDPSPCGDYQRIGERQQESEKYGYLEYIDDTLPMEGVEKENNDGIDGNGNGEALPECHESEKRATHTFGNQPNLR